MPTLCVSVPVAAPTINDRAADVLLRERFDLTLVHVLDIEALGC